MGFGAVATTGESVGTQPPAHVQAVKTPFSSETTPRLQKAPNAREEGLGGCLLVHGPEHQADAGRTAAVVRVDDHGHLPMENTLGKSRRRHPRIVAAKQSSCKFMWLTSPAASRHPVPRQPGLPASTPRRASVRLAAPDTSARWT